ASSSRCSAPWACRSSSSASVRVRTTWPPSCRRPSSTPSSADHRPPATRGPHRRSAVWPSYPRRSAVLVEGEVRADPVTVDDGPLHRDVDVGGPGPAAGRSLAGGGAALDVDEVVRAGDLG